MGPAANQGADVKPAANWMAAATLYVQQTAVVHNLWTVYVVATFAAAGFGASTSDLGKDVVAAVTLGFWLFALGHLSLLWQALSLLEALRLDLDDARRPLAGRAAPAGAQPGAAGTDVKDAFRALIAITRIRNPVAVAVVIHLAIDLCVTVALWARFLRFL